MSAAQSRALRTALETRVFAPVYLLFGEDDFLKDEAVRRLCDAAVDPATRDFNLELRRAAELDGETLGSLLATPPLMADRRAVVVRDVSALKKDGRAALDRYLKSPAPDVLLILTAPAGAKIDKTLLERTSPVEFEPLNGTQLPKWITRQVEARGGTITPAAMELLQASVGSDLPMLRLEIDKLSSLAAGGVIEEAHVAEVVGVRREETLAQLLDAVAELDAPRALRLLPEILGQPKNGGVPLVMALGAQTLAIGYAQALRANGMHPAKIDGELYALLKSGGSVLTGRSWGDAVRCWSRASARWSAAQVDRALDASLIADRTLKGGAVSSEEQLMASMVLAMCGDRHSRAA